MSAVNAAAGVAAPSMRITMTQTRRRAASAAPMRRLGAPSAAAMRPASRWRPATCSTSSSGTCSAALIPAESFASVVMTCHPGAPGRSPGLGPAALSHRCDDCPSRGARPGRTSARIWKSATDARPDSLTQGVQSHLYTTQKGIVEASPKLLERFFETSEPLLAHKSSEADAALRPYYRGPIIIDHS